MKYNSKSCRAAQLPGAVLLVPSSGPSPCCVQSWDQPSAPTSSRVTRTITTTGVAELRTFAPIPAQSHRHRSLSTSLNRFRNVVSDHFLEGASRMGLGADTAEGHDTGKQSTAVLEVSCSGRARRTWPRRCCLVAQACSRLTPTRWHRPPRSPNPTKPRWRSWPAGYEIVVTTVGQSVPEHICDPLAEPAAHAAKHDHLQAGHQTLTDDHHTVINT